MKLNINFEKSQSYKWGTLHMVAAAPLFITLKELCV